jgi:lipopolysaccharide export system permease protein
MERYPGTPRKELLRMKIIPRYLAREFIQNFFLGLAAFSAIILIVESFERVNAFLQNKAPMELMGAYFLNKIPSILFLVAPAAILLSVLITLGLMSRHNEILAMKSGGISLRRITLPILGVVLIIYCILLGMNEYIVPPANQKVRIAMDLIIHKKKPSTVFRQNQLWIHSHQTIYNIRLYHPEKDFLEGVTFYRFDGDFRIVERVDARSARWQDSQWIFSEVSVTRFSADGFPVRKKYPELTLTLPETPTDFRIIEKNPEEMNYRELREYVRKIEHDGYDSTKYRCAMHAIFSYPFFGVIMAFLGIPIALRKERGAGVALGVVFSILISSAYFLVFSISLSLGKAGTIPPFLSAWLGNFIFALVGAYLFLSVRH